jgi:hypothetical protein
VTAIDVGGRPAAQSSPFVFALLRRQPVGAVRPLDVRVTRLGEPQSSTILGPTDINRYFGSQARALGPAPKYPHRRTDLEQADDRHPLQVRHAAAPPILNLLGLKPSCGEQRIDRRDVAVLVAGGRAQAPAHAGTPPGTPPRTATARHPVRRTPDTRPTPPRHRLVRAAHLAFPTDVTSISPVVDGQRLQCAGGSRRRLVLRWQTTVWSSSAMIRQGERWKSLLSRP